MGFPVLVDGQVCDCHTPQVRHPQPPDLPGRRSVVVELQGEYEEV